MLDLFLDIMDWIKGLINARKESNKELFDGFVTPLYDKFCAMHKEYMKSFREYRKMLKSDSYPFDEKQLILIESRPIVCS